MESGSTISDTIAASQGKPLSVVVVRNGNERHARAAGGDEGSTGPIASASSSAATGLLAAGGGARRRRRVTGVVSKDIVTSLGNLVTG